MSQKPDKSHFKFIQQQYKFLSISIEQAEWVHYYETECSEIGNLSIWEEHAYYVTSFSKFLNLEQQAIFKKHMDERLAEDEKALAERDKKEEKSVLLNIDLLKYCEEELLPDFINKVALYRFANLFWSGENKAKVDLLKAEYQIFLKRQKAELLSNHFRYHRSFAPFELEKQLLKHQLNQLWPDYFSFKRAMDLPTQAADEYLLKRLPDSLIDGEDLLKKRVLDFHSFQLQLMKKYHSLPDNMIQEKSDWSADERQHFLMTLALIGNCYPQK